MKPSRNDPCPCGSGKKYKRCHLEGDQTLARGQRVEAAAVDFENPKRRGGFADQMVEFARPLIDRSDGSEEQIQKAMSIGMVCWNIGIMPPAERAAAIEALERDVVSSDQDRQDFRDVVGLMLRRYDTLFAQP